MENTAGRGCGSQGPACTWVPAHRAPYGGIGYEHYILFCTAQILLPGEQIPLEQWGCIACDQFTSDPGYWARAEAAAGVSPSTLRLILPEVFLGAAGEQQRIDRIHQEMQQYAHQVLTRSVQGFIYLERTLRSGRVRQGLVGCVDLEAYSYKSGAQPAVRPSEHTVQSRIPPG